jgi:hypothetical protein
VMRRFRRGFHGSRLTPIGYSEVTIRVLWARPTGTRPRDEARPRLELVWFQAVQSKSKKERVDGVAACVRRLVSCLGLIVQSVVVHACEILVWTEYWFGSMTLYSSRYNVTLRRTSASATPPHRSVEKPPDRPSDILHVEEERVVTPNPAELVIRHTLITRHLERVCQLPLLLHREEHIGMNRSFRFTSPIGSTFSGRGASHETEGGSDGNGNGGASG